MAYRKIIFIILVFLFIPCSTDAAWKYNPFTKKQDFHNGADETQTLTNKEIDCALNTCLNIGGAASYLDSFIDSDLTAGQMNVNHGLDTTYFAGTAVFDNNDLPVVGYTITPVDSDNATLDLTGFGTLSGTWNLVIIAGSESGSGTSPIGWVVSSPVDTDEIPHIRMPFNFTVTRIDCLVDPADTGESVVVTVKQCDSNGDNCAGIDGATTITCGNTNTTDDGSLSNASVTAGDYMWLTIDTVTGTVSYLSLTVTGNR